MAQRGKKIQRNKAESEKILNARQVIVRTDSPIPCVLSKKGGDQKLESPKLKYFRNGSEGKK